MNPEQTGKSLRDMTKSEIIEYASERGLDGLSSSLTKDQLIEIVNEWIFVNAVDKETLLKHAKELGIEGINSDWSKNDIIDIIMEWFNK